MEIISNLAAPSSFCFTGTASVTMIFFAGATSTYKITNVAAPTSNNDVATKAYVDAAVEAAGGGTEFPSGYVAQFSSTSTIDGWTFLGGTQTIQADYWTAKTSMPTGRSYMSKAAAVVNNKIYVIGGYNGGIIAKNEEYDPATNTWATKADMLTPRYGMAVAVANNKIYAIGGASSAGYGGGYYVNEEYDPATNTWATKANSDVWCAQSAAATVNNKIYQMGGGNLSNGGPCTSNSEYTPATNTWATKAAIPTAQVGPTLVTVNNKIYLMGGNTEFINYAGYAKNYEYTPATNTWATKADLPTPRGSHVAGVANNKIYIIGGSYHNGSSWVYPTANEEYDPAANTWTTKTTPVPVTFSASAAASVNNKIYVFGGDSTLTNTYEYVPSNIYYYFSKN